MSSRLSGSASIDTTLARSGSRSLLLEVQELGKAYALKPFTRQATREIFVAFSVHVASLDAVSGELDLAMIALGEYELLLERASDGDLSVEEEWHLGKRRQRGPGEASPLFLGDRLSPEDT